jgi:dihydrofolate reductase
MIRLIAAIDRKRGIAKNGDQPWHVPEDEKYFKQQTMQYGGNVLIGRKLYELIGRPLKDRRNIVLSQSQEHIEGTEVAKDLSILNTLSDVWVIGGASVFEQTISQADELYITYIEADFNCDLFFPEFEHSFRLVKEDDLREQNGFLFRYCVYERIRQ